MPTAAAEPVELVLATGSSSGTYHRVGVALADLINGREPGFRITLRTTGGSVENVKLLDSGEADLAIVQNDIAYLAERGLSPFEGPSSRLRGVLMLYAEPVLIFSNQPGFDRLAPPLPTPIATGQEGSGIFVNALTILKAAEAWEPLASQRIPPSDIASALVDGRVGLAFGNRLDEALSDDLAAGRIGLVSLPQQLLDGLTKTYPYYEPYVLRAGGGTWRGVAVTSMLVARSDVDPALVARLTQTALENRGALVALSLSGGGELLSEPSGPIQSMPLYAWHAGAERVLTQAGLLTPTGAPAALLAAAGGAGIVVFLYLLLNVIVYGFRGLGLRRFRWYPNVLYYLKGVNLGLMRRKYLALVLLLAGVFVGIVLGIQRLELDWAIRHNSTSNFAQRRLGDNLLWMLVFSGSGYEDSLFPKSPEGKFLATLLPLVGASGFLALVGLLTSDHIKRHILAIKGLRVRRMDGHILICGWNPTVPALVRSLLDCNVHQRRPIMVLADPEAENPLQAAGIDSANVAFTRGSATRRKDLERAHFDRAATAILVADQGISDPDATNVLKILTVEKLARELGKRRGGIQDSNIYTIAEIGDPEHYEALARDAMVDEIVSIGHIGCRVLVQSALNHGVSTFLNEVLTFNQDNEFYSYEVKAGDGLEDHTFDDLLPMLRRHHVLLLAVSLECGGFRERQEEVLAAARADASGADQPHR